MTEEGAGGPGSSLPDMSDPDGRLEIEVSEGAAPVVTLVGEVDPHTAPELDRVLTELTSGGATEIHLDCARLDFIDSSGLRVLVDAHRRLGAERGTVVLAGASSTLRRLLEVTGLDEHLVVEDGAA